MTGRTLRFGPPHTEAWYDARRRTVTASNSASLMLTPEELPWHEDDETLAARILGRTPGPPRSIKMEAGTHFETANLGWFGACIGRLVEPDGWLTVDPDRPWLGASIDARLRDRSFLGAAVESEPALVVHDTWGRQHVGHDAVQYLLDVPAGAVVETKHVESRNRSRFAKADPPAYYGTQLRHQMAVVGERHGLLVARVDAYELWVHHLVADPAWEARLDERCRAFWEKHIRPSIFD